MITPATQEKREQLLLLIERVLRPQPAVQAVLAIGSLATGLARPDSDIDAIVFLEPLDLYAIPAEFNWRPADGAFLSIFSQEPGEMISYDFARLQLADLRDPQFPWPEGRLHEFHAGWLAFDRYGEVGPLLTARTTYPQALRTSLLDDAITWLDQHLGDDGPQVRWDKLGPAIAHDRLNAAYGYLVQALFAYNRRWRPWRNRQMASLLRLPWLPPDFERRVLPALNAPSLDYGGYMQRAHMLQALFTDLLERLIFTGEYGGDPIEEAFIRDHDEPGRAWNMQEWNREHQKRRPIQGQAGAV